MTVSNPDTGDKLVITTASSAAVGSSCPPGTTSGSCQLTVPVLTPGLTIVKTASTTTPTPGLKVIYTITVTDTGQTTYSGASLSDPLGGVLDDAAYNNDVVGDRRDGVLRRVGGVLDREPEPQRHRDHHLFGHHQQPRNRRPDPGQHCHLPDPGSNCAAASTDPRCTVTLTVVNAATLTITATAAPSAIPGGVVTYTITVANTGQSHYAGAALTVPLSGVLGGAAYNGDAAALTGTGTGGHRVLHQPGPGLDRELSPAHRSPSPIRSPWTTPTPATTSLPPPSAPRPRAATARPAAPTRAAPPP